MEWWGAVLPVCRGCLLGWELRGNGLVSENFGCSGGDLSVLCLPPGGKEASWGGVRGVPAVIREGAGGEWSGWAGISHGVARTHLILAKFTRDSEDLCACG